MTIFEFEREALKNLKGKPLKAKLEHIATYYWIPIVSAIVVVSLIVFIAYSAATKKETVLFGYCINAGEQLENANSLTDGFTEHAGITEKQEILLLPNLRTTSTASLNDTMQALTIHVAAEEVDFITSDKETCQSMILYDYFCDLSQKLSPQLLEQLAPYLLYAERAEVFVKQDSAAEEMPPLPQLEKADLLSDPVPVALALPAGNPLSEAYPCSEEEAVMLIMPNAPHLDMLELFICYILE